MHKQVMAMFVAVVFGAALCSAHPVENGKYSDGRYEAVNDGRYHADGRNEGHPDGRYDSTGQYVHSVQPYRHTPDNRELGFYVHIPNPYDGGYGPYAGLLNPYIHDARPYDHNLYTSTTTKKPTTTTKRTTTTTTTTTTTPRNILFNYDEEGRHKILHQENKRKQDKYDHAYLTENGIYGEEQAKLHHAGGTDAMGYYEYTGDDGKLYRVNYESNHNGFTPMGDHIHPVPEAITRALKYVEETLKANGNMPLFDDKGFPINRMPKEMMKKMPKDVMASLKKLHVEEMHMPKMISDQIHMLQLEIEEEEREEAELAKHNKL